MNWSLFLVLQNLKINNVPFSLTHTLKLLLAFSKIYSEASDGAVLCVILLSVPWGGGRWGGPDPFSNPMTRGQAGAQRSSPSPSAQEAIPRVFLQWPFLLFPLRFPCYCEPVKATLNPKDRTFQHEFTLKCLKWVLPPWLRQKTTPFYSLKSLKSNILT